MTRPEKSDQQAWVPVPACTLPAVDQPPRADALDQLFRTAVLSTQLLSPTRAHLRLRLDPEVAAQVAGLAAREIDCCSFFTFTLTIGSAGFGVDIAVPTEHQAVLNALLARAGLVTSARR